MGAFMAVLGIGGAGLGAYGQYSAGQQAEAVGKYNAAIERQKAQLVEQASASETTRAHQAARRLKGSQMAAFAASGAELSSGTPLLVMAEQAGAMEMDILEQRRTRAIEAQGLRSQATMMEFEGKQAKRAGTMSAFTTLLGGGASAGAGYMGSK